MPTAPARILTLAEEEKQPTVGRQLHPLPEPAAERPHAPDGAPAITELLVRPPAGELPGARHLAGSGSSQPPQNRRAFLRQHAPPLSKLQNGNVTDA